MKMKRIACVLIVVALVALGVHFESKVLIRKDGAEKFEAYYEHPADYDVLFYGNSHVLNGITPLELWRDYGIASYNMAMSGGTIGACYWSLMDALQYAQPRLVVLDGSYVAAKPKMRPDYINALFDAMPMSRVKLAAANDLYRDPREVFEKVLVPFCRYHSRWFELEEEDFTGRFPNLLGYAPLTNATPADLEGMEPETSEPINSVNAEYMRKIIRVCQERNIGLLLMVIPYDESEEGENETAWTRDTAAEYGLDYLSPNWLATAVDPEVDYSNSESGNSHLNHRGAKKMTHLLGKYLAEHFDLPDRRGESAYAHWEQAFLGYLDREDEWLREAKKWKYLLVLSDNDRYMPVVEVLDDALWREDQFESLMACLGVEADALGELPAAFVRQIAGAPAQRIGVSELAEAGLETPLGLLRGEADGALLLGGTELLASPEDELPGVRIALVDREKGTLVHRFDLRPGEEAGKIQVTAG